MNAEATNIAREGLLCLQEYEGSTANNLLFDFGDFGLQSVFIAPTAPSEARYKAMARDSAALAFGVFSDGGTCSERRGYEYCPWGGVVNEDEGCRRPIRARQ